MERPRPVPPYSCSNIYHQKPAQPRRNEATHTCRRTISLTEGIKDEIQLVFGDTNTGICYTKFNRHALVIQGKEPRAECHMAFARHLGRCKLDRVAHQVGNNLAQAERVTDKLVGNVGINIVCEVEVILRGANNERLENAKYSLPQGIRYSFHGHATSLD